MTMTGTLQLVGLLGGVIGAVLVAGRTPQQRTAGFMAWILGNGAWVGYAALTGTLALGVQFGIFFLLFIFGALNNYEVAA